MIDAGARRVAIDDNRIAAMDALAGPNFIGPHD
jgi:hypothetical protein